MELKARRNTKMIKKKKKKTPKMIRLSSKRSLDVSKQKSKCLKRNTRRCSWQLLLRQWFQKRQMMKNQNKISRSKVKRIISRLQADRNSSKNKRRRKRKNMESKKQKQPKFWKLKRLKKKKDFYMIWISNLQKTRSYKSVSNWTKLC